MWLEHHHHLHGMLPQGQDTIVNEFWLPPLLHITPEAGVCNWQSHCQCFHALAARDIVGIWWFSSSMVQSSNNGILLSVKRGWQLSNVWIFVFQTCIKTTHKSMEWLRSSFVAGPLLGQWINSWVQDSGRGKSPLSDYTNSVNAPHYYRGSEVWGHSHHTPLSMPPTLLFCKMFNS